MDRPCVSVIIPVYNGERFIRSAIESVLAQSIKEWELVIVNDGSVDNSALEIRPFLGLSNVHFTEQENKGIAATLNKGIELSSGEFIALLDQDDVWVPEKLELQVSLMRSDPDIALVHGNINFIDEDGKEFDCADHPSVTEGSGYCFASLFLSNRLFAPTVMVRRTCLNVTGLFDESFRYAMDYDLWLRIAHEYPIKHINHTLALYRRHGSNQTRNLVALHEEVLNIVRKTLRQFPDTSAQVGPEQVAHRLQWLQERISELRYESDSGLERDNPTNVSVILPVYNGERFVTQAIESVLAQTYKNFELIIVDDGSTDRTVDRIKPYLREPNVRYIKQRNRGLASARNTGIKSAKGRYLAFLDHDDLYTPDKLEIQVAYLTAHPEFALVHGNLDFIDETGHEYILPVPYITDASGECFERLFLCNAVSVPAVLVRKEYVDRIGRFDESLRYAEDYDLWLRLAYFHSFGHIERVFASVRKHSANMSRNSIKHNAYVLKVLKKVFALFPDILERVPMAKHRICWLTEAVAKLYYESDRRILGYWYSRQAARMKKEI